MTFQIPNFNGAPLKYGNGEIISSHTYWACDYLLGFKLIRISKEGLWSAF